MNQKPFQKRSWRHRRRKDFSRGITRVFSYIFPWGAKSGEIWYFPLETKRTTFFAENFKIQRGQGPPDPAA